MEQRNAYHPAEIAVITGLVADIQSATRIGTRILLSNAEGSEVTLSESDSEDLGDRITNARFNLEQYDSVVPENVKKVLEPRVEGLRSRLKSVDAEYNRVTQA